MLCTSPQPCTLQSNQSQHWVFHVYLGLWRRKTKTKTTTKRGKTMKTKMKKTAAAVKPLLGCNVQRTTLDGPRFACFDWCTFYNCKGKHRRIQTPRPCCGQRAPRFSVGIHTTKWCHTVPLRNGNTDATGCLNRARVPRVTRVPHHVQHPSQLPWATTIEGT